MRTALVNRARSLYERLDTTRPNQIATVQGIFPQKGRIYTVQFGLGRVATSSGAKLNPMARINFLGEDGQGMCTRLVSIIDGSQISGVGDSVLVGVYDDSSLLTGTDQTYEVFVNIVPGTRPQTPNPPVYHPVIQDDLAATYAAGSFSLAAAGARDIPIPRNVGITSVKVQGFPATGAYTSVNTGEYAATLISGVTLMGGWDCYQPTTEWQPLNPSADVLTVHNYSANPAVFLVAFGIDG
jgi:hypothetical protein